MILFTYFTRGVDTPLPPFGTPLQINYLKLEEGAIFPLNPGYYYIVMNMQYKDF